MRAEMTLPSRSQTRPTLLAGDDEDLARTPLEVEEGQHGGETELLQSAAQTRIISEVADSSRARAIAMGRVELGPRPTAKK